MRFQTKPGLFYNSTPRTIHKLFMLWNKASQRSHYRLRNSCREMFFLSPSEIDTVSYLVRFVSPQAKI